MSNGKAVQKIANCEILGYVDLRHPTRKPIRKLLVPPNLRGPVYFPHYEFLEDTFCRDLEGRPFEHPLHVGWLESNAKDMNGIYKPLKFYINGQDFAKQHFLITGTMGSGKTHMATIIIEELANKLGYPIIVFDPHGEYSTISAIGDHLRELIVNKDLSLSHIEEELFNYEVAIHAFNHEEAVNTLKRVGAEDNQNLKLIPGQWMGIPKDNAKFTNELKLALQRGMRPRKVTVFNMRGLSTGNRSKVFNGFMNILYRERGEPLIIIVEEAENLVQGSQETFRWLASEGRKIGVSMCLICNRPTDVSETVLSQMGTIIMGRTVDSQSLNYLKNVAGTKTSRLPTLRTGEWIINGITMRQPTKVIMRDRFSLSI